jgi:ferrous iron transport protein B
MSAVEVRGMLAPVASARVAAVADAADTVTGPPVVAIAGRPNVGKSTLFAHATGRFAESANVPGTTVHSARERITLAGREAILVDLPGTLTITDASDGLPPFWQLLLDAKPDAVLVVVDAGDLARHLPLALACRDTGLPLVVAANLVDEATARGVEIDAGRLSQLLAAPVIPTVGRRGDGVQEAVAEAVRRAEWRRSDGTAHRSQVVPAVPYAPKTVANLRAAMRAPGGLGPDLSARVAAGQLTVAAASALADPGILEPERWAVAARWAAEVERRSEVQPGLAQRLGRAVTAPWPGLGIFVAATLAILGITMLAGGFLAGVLGSAWQAAVSPLLATVVNAVVPWPAVASAVLWGLDSGLLAMLSVGIPFILTFYVLLALLEDSGYLAATAVLTDRLVNALGLPGRAAIPILAATGCSVPAIYGTRVLETRRERMLASFLVVLTPCSARSAVVIAALTPLAGPGPALAAFAVVAIVTFGAGMAANAILPGHQSALVLELPPLRLPVARQVVLKAWHRFRSFVRTATPLMLAGSFLLGLAYETGAIEPVQGAIGPGVVWLLGLPPVAGIALLLAFLRKELALQLLLVLAIAQYGAAASGAAGLGGFMSAEQVFVYAVVTAVSIPCIATLATLAGELGWRVAATITGAVLGISLLVGAVLARLLGIA